jgi:hypothetical protein
MLLTFSMLYSADVLLRSAVADSQRTTQSVFRAVRCLIRCRREASRLSACVLCWSAEVDKCRGLIRPQVTGRNLYGTLWGKGGGSGFAAPFTRKVYLAVTQWRRLLPTRGAQPILCFDQYLLLRSRLLPCCLAAQFPCSLRRHRPRLLPSPFSISRSATTDVATAPLC